VNRTHARGGKVIIPSFALERAQEVIYELKRLRAENRIPKLPVYVDSPLTVKLTDVFKLHPDCYDRETYELLQSGQSPFDFDGLEYISEVEQSKAIDSGESSCIIISASGMCEAGRVLHHLRCTIESEKNTVVIVGYQAEHTLGRRLVERRGEVRIFGLMHERRAEVVVLDGFSAHADQAGLVGFAEQVQAKGALRQLILVHGEPGAQGVLADVLSTRGFSNVSRPKPGERIRL
jgi:metallo-beta-lactamase family protein